jgi:SAM-dependent methyltransferase
VAQEKYQVKNPVVAFLIQRFFHRIAGVLTAVAPESVLDAGCGEGELLRRGVLTSVPTVSLDRSRQALAEIRTHTPGCRPVSGSVLELPFARASFDAVVCLEVLEHLEDPRAAVEELLRVARRAVVLSVPYEPWFRLGNLLRGKYLSGLGNHPEHIQHWNPRRFRHFLAAAGWEVGVVEAFPWIVACLRPPMPKALPNKGKGVK